MNCPRRENERENIMSNERLPGGRREDGNQQQQTTNDKRQTIYDKPPGDRRGVAGGNRQHITQTSFVIQ
jgi:hypothetical protein